MTLHGLESHTESQISRTDHVHAVRRNVENPAVTVSDLVTISQRKLRGPRLESRDSFSTCM